MADDSGDIEMGYIDDDIEIDDDLDEDLGGTSSAAGSSQSLRKPKRAPVSAKPPKKPADTSAPHPKDLLLRPGSKPNRDILLARFNPSKIPELRQASKVRMYRQYEGTVRARERGLKRDAAEVRRSESYVGQKRQQRARESGSQVIMDKDKKSWVLEVTPQDVVPATPPREDGKHPEGAVVYKSKYDGVPPGAYFAVMVAHRDGKHVDVVPIGQYAWHTFRKVSTDLKVVESGLEKAEATMKKIAKRCDTKMGKMENKVEALAEIRESLQGGFNRFEEKRGLANYGLRRKVNKEVEADKAKSSAGLDYEQEFDNDDVAQVDREDEPEKAEKAKSRKQIKKEQAELTRVLKDEDVPVASAKSDSDEDESEEEGAREKSPEVVRKVAAAAQGGSRAGTPMEDVLMKPTKANVSTALRKETMDKGRPKAKLQDVLKHFERNTAQKKKLLTDIIKSIALISIAMEAGKKVYYVAPKPDA